MISTMRYPLLRPLVIRNKLLQPALTSRLAFQGPNSSVAKSRTLQRCASTQTEANASGSSRALNFFYGTTLLLGFGIIYFYITDTRASAHRWITVPILRLLYRDPERAHEAGNSALKSLWRLGLYPRERGDPDQTGDLSVEVFGRLLKNPIGTSAGIDKHADIPDPLMAIGPAVVEIGGVTPLPQPGNDKPRVFRIASQNAMINRYGLNSHGADSLAAKLRHRVREYAYEHGLGHDQEAEDIVLNGGAGVPPGSLTQGKLLAINIAKNKSTPEDNLQAVSNDYVFCAQRLAPYADILVVNVSSPNTPGLRSLQKSESLTKILTSVVHAAKYTDRKVKPAVMVKVSPDEDSDDQVLGIAQAVWDSGVDGVIVGNTTNQRPAQLPHLRNLTPIEEQHLLQQGGFSGPHLFEKTLTLVTKYKKLLDFNPSQVGSTTRKAGSLAAVADGLRTEIQVSAKTNATGKVDSVTSSVETGVVPAQNLSGKPDTEKKSLFNPPAEKFYSQSTEEQNKIRTSPTSSETAPTKNRTLLQPRASTYQDDGKVIFATGGITNGEQALQVLNAGASVAMVYTALVYGGVGTISRIKDEMRTQIQKESSARNTQAPSA